MLLANLAAFDSVEEAAEGMAGNYKNWRCFMWFGEDDVPDNQNVMLGYLVNNMNGSLAEEANAKVVQDAMKPFMGDLTEGGLVDEFGSDFCGDSNALSGLQVRVYDSEGNITEPFRILYELGLKQKEEGLLDRAVYEKLNEQRLRKYVDEYLKFEDIQPRPNTEDVLSILQEQDIEYDYIDDTDVECAVAELSQ